jgi:nicotinate-nucleotide pyrophosphorylase (carboxylating)
MPEPLAPAVYLDLVRRALAEDVGAADITTGAIVPSGLAAAGTIVAREPCVLAGMPVAQAVFLEVDPTVTWRAERQDGDVCEAGAVVAKLRGSAAALLTAERTALNFLQHLSGIATLTREFVDAAEGHLTILDTRKTVPTLRALAKYAVRCGGGTNHRFGLHDGILIKDNHIRIAGSIADAVQRVRAAESGRLIEVEAETVDQIDEAVAAGADVVMLDNFDDEAVAAAICRIAGRARVELSGSMSLDRVRRLATSGADCISVGALTHSARAVDLSLDLELAEGGRAPRGA